MNDNQHMYDNTSRTAEQNLTKLVSEWSLHGGKSEEWKMTFVTKSSKYENGVWRTWANLDWTILQNDTILAVQDECHHGFWKYETDKSQEPLKIF